MYFCQRFYSPINLQKMHSILIITISHYITSNCFNNPHVQLLLLSEVKWAWLCASLTEKISIPNSRVNLLTNYMRLSKRN